MIDNISILILKAKYMAKSVMLTVVWHLQNIVGVCKKKKRT